MFMEFNNGVIVILPNGEYCIEEASEINSRHWGCFKEIEKKLNLNSNYGTDAMEHAWFLARNGIISIQVAKRIDFCIIVSPIVDKISENQLNKFNEIIKNNFSDIEGFGVDLVNDSEHKVVEIEGQYQFDYDGLSQIFGFDACKSHKKL